MKLASEAQVPVRPFSVRLREETQEAHHEAEGSRFVTALLTGRLDRNAYASLATQHWFIYQALEEAAGGLRADPVVSEFLTDGLARLPALRSDLEFLVGPDWSAQLTPLPATVAYCGRIRTVGSTWPAGYIAHHYTRYLGDLSGGQVVRRTLQRRYGLDGRGTAFYDFWALGSPAAFKRSYRARLDALPYPPSELDQLVAEVRTVFRHNQQVFAELDERYPAS